MPNIQTPDFELHIHNNNTIRLRIAVIREGAVVNLTGATFKAIFRRWATDSEANALLVITNQSYFTVETPSSGIAILTIPVEETTIFNDGDIVHLEVILTESNGVVTSVADGILVIG